MKNILFISKGESASSTRYRSLQYFPSFIKAGWHPKHVTISGGIIATAKALIAAKNADVVVLLRKTFPYPIFWILRKLSKKLIFDFDDAIFCNSNGTSSKTRMARFKKTVSQSDLIFAGNQYLANQAQLYNPHVVLVPTAISVERYDLLAPKPAQYVDIVWIGSKSTSKYLIEILPGLELAASKIDNLRLKIVADFVLSSPLLNILTETWSSDTEVQALTSSHIAIAPLRDDAWSKGKCALKVLQYMAAGLPVVSSPSGMNADVVINNKTGCFAKSHEDWSLCIQDLARNSDLRKQFGQAGKKAVFSYHLENIFSIILSQVEKLKKTSS